MLILHDITYIHPNRDLLFAGIDLVVNKNDKIALIGNNGTGKSTLLKILAGNLQPASGVVKTTSKSYYVPQIFGQYNAFSVAEALQIADKLNALKQILEGNGRPSDVDRDTVKLGALRFQVISKIRSHTSYGWRHAKIVACDAKTLRIVVDNGHALAGSVEHRRQ